MTVPREIIKPFNKKNVISSLKSKISNCVWNKNHLPLTDELRRKYDYQIEVMESLLDEIRDMPLNVE